MIDHLRARQLMAENGFEHTPAEAKKMTDAVERITDYENYLYLLNMTEEDIKRDVATINRSNKKITVREFKEVREFALDIGHARHN